MNWGTWPGARRVVVATAATTSVFGSTESATAQEVPFVPTPHAVVRAMLAFAAPVAGDTLLDLGSGDGRIVLAGATLHQLPGWGVEILPQLVRSSSERARALGVDDIVSFKEGDIFESTLSGASIITLYLLPETNVKVAGRLLGGARPGTRVISHTFDLGEWSPDSAIVVTHPEGESTVYKWIVPALMSGTWEMRESGSAATTTASTTASTTAASTAATKATTTANSIAIAATAAARLSITQRFQHVTAELRMATAMCTSLTGRVRALSASLRVSCDGGAESQASELLLTLSSDTLFAELHSADANGRRREVRRFRGVRSTPGDQSGTPFIREIGKSPLDQDAKPVAKAREVEDVKKEPYPPRQPSGEV